MEFEQSKNYPAVCCEGGCLIAEVIPFHSRSVKQAFKLICQMLFGKVIKFFSFKFAKCFVENRTLQRSLTLQIYPVCFYFLNDKIMFYHLSRRYYVENCVIQNLV